MATYRENNGFHIDTFARVVRNTLLNERLALPLAALTTVLAHPSSTPYLQHLPSFLTTLSPSLLSTVTCAALYLGTTGLLFTVNAWLNKWAANNFTPSDPGEWTDWAGKELVVVTGGSSGIGAQVVKGLFARNPRTRVVVVDFAPLGWAVPEGVTLAGGSENGAKGAAANLWYFQADLSKADSVRDVCRRIKTEVGDPTVLVNNAGLVRGFTVLDGTYADVEVTVKTNLLAPFLLAKEFLPAMVSHNHGHILNLCSTSALMPPPDIVDYAATKAGIQAFHEGLGMEVRARYGAPKVRLTNVVFNFVRTEIIKGHPSQPQFLMPVLHVETAGEVVVNALYSGYGGVVFAPGIMRYLAMLRAAPEWFVRFALMDGTKNLAVDFKGRQEINKSGGVQPVSK